LRDQPRVTRLRKRAQVCRYVVLLWPVIALCLWLDAPALAQTGACAVWLASGSEAGAVRLGDGQGQVMVVEPFAIESDGHPHDRWTISASGSGQPVREGRRTWSCADNVLELLEQAFDDAGARETFEPPLRWAQLPLTEGATWSWEGEWRTELHGASASYALGALFTVGPAEVVTLPEGEVDAYPVTMEAAGAGTSFSETLWLAPDGGLRIVGWSVLEGESTVVWSADALPRQPDPSVDPTGRLSVSSRPAGRVFVDGRDVERDTPVHRMELPVGLHEVRVLFEGLGRMSEPRHVDVAAGRTVSVFITAEPDNPEHVPGDPWLSGTGEDGGSRD
jgi:hypothetical protein